MKCPEIPDNEAERLAALHRLGILDTEAEERFDRLTALACFAFKVDIALVSLIDANRQWFKSTRGLDVRQTDRESSFCGHAINEAHTLVIPDALEDNRFFDNPLVTGPPHIRFYAGAPLTDADGYVLGTFCLIDSRPRQMTAEELVHLRYLADQVEREIAHNDWRQALSEQKTARQLIQDREQLLRTIIDNLPVNIYVKDLAHRKTLANKSEQDFVGVHSEAELLGLSDADIYPFHGDLLVLGEEEDQRVTRHGESIIDKETRALDENGKETQFRLSKLPLYNSNNEIIGLVGISIDITREKAAARQTERQILALKLLQDIGSQVGPDMGERMRRALRIGLNYLDMDLGIISQLENTIYSIRWAQSNQDIPVTENQTLSLEDTYCQFLFENNGELSIEHMGKSRYADHKAYQLHQLESYLGSLLTANGQVIGTLNFTAKNPRRRPFDDGERLFMRLLCRWVAAELERSQSEEKLNDLMAQVPGMIYQFRLWPDGRSAFLYSSPGVTDIFQVPMETAMDDIEQVFKRIHKEDLNRVATSMQESAQLLSIWECQYRVYDDNGSFRWVEGHATPKRTLDGGTIWHGYLHDIDERKKLNNSSLNLSQPLAMNFARH